MTYDAWKLQEPPTVDVTDAVLEAEEIKQRARLAGVEATAHVTWEQDERVVLATWRIELDVPAEDMRHELARELIDLARRICPSAVR